jgi:ABC-type Fe3+-hydroxamate transport system substrate-binding protein
MQLPLDPPRRIISLAPSLTEFLVAIGLGDQLVGVTDFCTLPEALQPTRVGGIGNPDLDLIAALAPDLVLVDRTPGGPHASAVLAASLPTHAVVVRSVGSALAELADLARLLGAADRASALVRELHAAQDAAYARQYTRRMRRVVAFTWRDPWLAVGGDTFADDLLRLCGAENIALRMVGRSPRAGLETFMRYNPEVILLARGGYPFEADDARAFWRFGDVAAVMRRRIHVCDEALLTRFGVRLPLAIEQISALIHAD